MLLFSQNFASIAGKLQSAPLAIRGVSVIGPPGGFIAGITAEGWIDRRVIHERATRTNQLSLDQRQKPTASLSPFMAI